MSFHCQKEQKEKKIALIRQLVSREYHTRANNNRGYTGGPRISRFFGGKKIPHYAKPRYAGTIYSTSLVLKTAKRGKLFFKVHFLSIFSYLELCIAHQIDAIFNANSNLVSN